MNNNYEIKTITGVPGWVDNLGKADKVSEGADAYSLVPLVFRALRIRCNALSAMPFKLMQGKVEKKWDEVFISPLKDLLWKTEAALLLNGAAYWLAMDKGAKRLGAQWLNPFTMTVKAEQKETPEGTYQVEMSFIQKINGLQDKSFAREQITYFKEFGIKDDVQPGVSAARVALGDAKLMQFMVLFSSVFFEGGAMPVTVLGVDQSAPDAEVAKLTAFFRKVAMGIKNAFNIIPIKGMNGAVTVTKLTPDLNTLALDENRNQSIQNIAWAFEIPETMLTDAANYATANSQRRSFYEETVNPRADMVAETITKQFLPKGWTLVACPEEMSIFQTDESERAESLNQLVAAGVPLELAMDILGYTLDDEQIAKLTIDPVGPTQPAPQTDVVNPDLVKFQRKAVKHIGEAVTFESDTLDIAVIESIRAELPSCKSEDEVKTVFAKHCKKSDNKISDSESRIDRLLSQLEKECGITAQ